MSLEIKQLTMKYGQQIILDKLDLAVKSGELVAVLGDSGSGKTTLLRGIIGLHRASHGQIILNGKDISNQPVHQRNIAVVFQDLRLFPHLSVEENITFPLKMKGIPRKNWGDIVDRNLASVRLNGYNHRCIHQLSGGQQQRIAIARALAASPDLLLLDEPFSSLDEPLRYEMRELLSDIQESLELTTLFITHDRNEAFQLAHRIAYLADKKVYQFASKKELVHHPIDRKVADFFGLANYLAGEVQGGYIKTDIGSFSYESGLNIGSPVTLMLRPTDISIAKSGERAWQVQSIQESLNYVTLTIHHPKINLKWYVYLSIQECWLWDLHLGDYVDIVINQDNLSIV